MYEFCFVKFIKRIPGPEDDEDVRQVLNVELQSDRGRGGGVFWCFYWMGYCGIDV
jgi:hypothetical protein